MKKLVIISSIFIFLAGLIVIALVNTVRTSDRFITIDQYHSYVYTETKKIKIPIFINQEKHFFYDDKSFSKASFKNEDESKKLDIELVGIEYSYSEEYLGELYHMLKFSFKMPRLSNGFYIADCFLELFSTNNKTYLFRIGDLDLHYYANVGVEEAFKIDALSGIKGSGTIGSRLGEIIVEGNTISRKQIKSISLGNNIKTIYEINDTEIDIKIEDQKQVLINPPIIITYSENSQDKYQIIDNFEYFIDYQMLSENGSILFVYGVS